MPPSVTLRDAIVRIYGRNTEVRLFIRIRTEECDTGSTVVD
jgi:hypothetical protein